MKGNKNVQEEVDKTLGLLDEIGRVQIRPGLMAHLPMRRQSIVPELLRRAAVFLLLAANGLLVYRYMAKSSTNNDLAATISMRYGLSDNTASTYYLLPGIKGKP